MYTNPPPAVAVEVESLRLEGWVPVLEAVNLTGRSLTELVRLQESGEIEIQEIGPWWASDAPRVVHMVHLSTLRQAPRRTGLALVPALDQGDAR